jgi:hypothetical protein
MQTTLIKKRSSKLFITIMLLGGEKENLFKSWEP